MKIPKVLQIPNKGLKNSRERKLKLKLYSAKTNLKYAKNVHVSFPMSRLEFLMWLASLWNYAWRVNTKKNKKGWEEEKNCYLKSENERDFLHPEPSG